MTFTLFMKLYKIFNIFSGLDFIIAFLQIRAEIPWVFFAAEILKYIRRNHSNENLMKTPHSYAYLIVKF